MRLGSLALTTLILGATACGSHSEYSCESSSQCVNGGTQGTCEPAGFCAFPDPACPSGDRFEPNAGGGLGGMCVPPGTGIDSGVDGMPLNCGAVGMACCPDNTCGDNAFCSSGTCQQCVTDIGVGAGHTCAVKYDGSVWCSGDNHASQLGNGMTGAASSARVQTRDNTGSMISDAKKIIAGDGHSCVLRTGGAVWCWGANDDGQIGDNTSGNQRNSARPVQVAGTGAPLTGIVALAAGNDSSCALDAAGTAWCWGSNGSGELGDGTIVSRAQAAQVLVAAAGAPFANIADIEMGASNVTCVRTTANAIWCFGYNGDGGVGNNSAADVSSPVHVFDGMSVSSGRRHVCAVALDGSVSCWGNAEKGRLGPGVGTDQSAPNPVNVSEGGAPLTGATAAVAAGLSCAVMANKQAQCWGTNPHGQLGTGVGVYTPTPVVHKNGTPLTGITRMLANHATVCAFLDTGALLCWGRNDEGELGDGTFRSTNFPEPVKVTCP